MAKTPSSSPTRPPASDPAMMPSHRTPNALAKIAPANAPSSSWPSIAMLMTPDRSHRQPASAPRISGIESDSVPWNWLMTLNVFAEPA